MSYSLQGWDIRTYKQALRGLFTTGTSHLIVKEQKKRSVANKGLNSANQRNVLITCGA